MRIRPTFSTRSSLLQIYHGMNEDWLSCFLNSFSINFNFYLLKGKKSGGISDVIISVTRLPNVIQAHHEGVSTGLNNSSITIRIPTSTKGICLSSSTSKGESSFPKFSFSWISKKNMKFYYFKSILKFILSSVYWIQKELNFFFFIQNFQ